MSEAVFTLTFADVWLVVLVDVVCPALPEVWLEPPDVCPEPPEV
jgi:hypothetical protein